MLFDIFAFVLARYLETAEVVETYCSKANDPKTTKCGTDAASLETNCKLAEPQDNESIDQYLQRINVDTVSALILSMIVDALRLPAHFLFLCVLVLCVYVCRRVVQYVTMASMRSFQRRLAAVWTTPQR